MGLGEGETTNIRHGESQSSVAARYFSMCLMFFVFRTNAQISNLPLNFPISRWNQYSGIPQSQQPAKASMTQQFLRPPMKVGLKILFHMTL